MKKSSARQFYQNYFTATRRTGWLTCLGAQQRLKMLEDLMQWSVTSPTSDCRLAVPEVIHAASRRPLSESLELTPVSDRDEQREPTKR